MTIPYSRGSHSDYWNPLFIANLPQKPFSLFPLKYCIFDVLLKSLKSQTNHENVADDYLKNVFYNIKRGIKGNQRSFLSDENKSLKISTDLNFGFKKFSQGSIPIYFPSQLTTSNPTLVAPFMIFCPFPDVLMKLKTHFLF